MPEKFSPSSAWASRRWRSAAMRKSAARVSNRPHSVRRSPAVRQAVFLDVDHRGLPELVVQVRVGLLQSFAGAPHDLLDGAARALGAKQLAQELCGVAPRDAVSDRESDDRCREARTESSPRYVGRKLGPCLGSAGRIAQPVQAMLAHRDRQRRQLGDLAALGRDSVNALVLAEETRIEAAAPGPMIDDLVHLFKRKQRATVARVAGLQRRAAGPRPPDAAAGAPRADRPRVAARSCVSLDSGAVRDRRHGSQAAGSPRSARRPA
jgi:hypothetical protein